MRHTHKRPESAVRAPDPPVRTVELTASHDAVKLEGVATILNTDALLQLDADIRSAKVAADFSSAQLARFRLSTMLSRQTLDNAERQAGIDASQLKLLETRLKQTWGEERSVLKDRRAPEPDRRNQRRRASYRPLRFSRPRQPDSRATFGSFRFAAVQKRPSRGCGRRHREILAMPGVSFFGLIPAGPGLRAGDRARLIAENPDSHPGVVIPSAAIVVFASQSWCYVETGDKKYSARPFRSIIRSMAVISCERVLCRVIASSCAALRCCCRAKRNPGMRAMTRMRHPLRVRPHQDRGHRQPCSRTIRQSRAAIRTRFRI